MATPGKKLRLARESQRPPVTRDELAAIQGAGSSYHRIAAYENGKAAPPKDLLARVSAAWRIPLEWFYDGKDGPPPSQDDAAQVVKQVREIRSPYSVGATVAIPVWSGVLAADEEEFYIVPDGEDPYEVPLFILEHHAPEDCFLIRAAGSSASPRIEHSELALCFKNDKPPVNSLVIAIRPDGAAYVKALKPGIPPSPYSLRPPNDLYKPITDVKGWTFAGSVFAILKSPEPGKPNIEWNHGAPLPA